MKLQNQNISSMNMVKLRIGILLLLLFGCSSKTKESNQIIIQAKLSIDSLVAQHKEDIFFNNFWNGMPMNLFDTLVMKGIEKEEFISQKIIYDILKTHEGMQYKDYLNEPYLDLQWVDRRFMYEFNFANEPKLSDPAGFQGEIPKKLPFTLLVNPEFKDSVLVELLFETPSFFHLLDINLKLTPDRFNTIQASLICERNRAFGSYCTDEIIKLYESKYGEPTKRLIKSEAQPSHETSEYSLVWSEGKKIISISYEVINLNPTKFNNLRSIRYLDKSYYEEEQFQKNKRELIEKQKNDSLLVKSKQDI